MEKCQSTSPVRASNATSAPSSSPVNTRPPAVETVPAHIVAGPVILYSQRISPVTESSARK